MTDILLRRVGPDAVRDNWAHFTIPLATYNDRISPIHIWFEGPHSHGLFACKIHRNDLRLVELWFEDHRVAMDFRLRFG